VLSEGCEKRSTIQCHYHAWTYGLDGSLRNAPRSDLEPGFDKSELSLLPASAGTWNAEPLLAAFKRWVAERLQPDA
jgi:phenylpropionate dioxygenase-like ring-hydroxylating dioxygenase large terminal subunit